MKTITNERAIAQQLLVEHWEKPMSIPDQFSGYGNRIINVNVGRRHYAVTLYHFNYGKQKGMAKGLWLISDLFKRNFRECQLGVRLA